MQRKALTRAAASSFIIAVTMVGCSGAVLDRPATASNGVSGKYATSATAALAKKDAARAVAAAETAVAGDPRNDGYRALLGRAYLLAGRYSSAETSFTDALALGNSDARTIVSLALVQVALGKGKEAQALLAAHRDEVPAADYGLALALAGDPQAGVQVLVTAARDPSSDSRTRQNLAYAYALAGKWPEARATAALDLSPEDAMNRVFDWARNANPDLAPQRVAMLTGVTPRPDDAGLPVRLALAAPTPDAVPVKQADATPAAPAAVETAAAAPVVAAPAELTAAPAIASLNLSLAPTPMVQPLPERSKQRVAAAPERVIRAPSTPMRVAAAKAFLPPQKTAQVQPVSGGAFAVQLGAYDSAAVAKEKFETLVQRNGAIARFPLVQTSATVNGRLFYRAAIGGFADAGSAGAMCRTLKAQGGNCFVRSAEMVAPAKPKLAVSAPQTKAKQVASK